MIQHYSYDPNKPLSLKVAVKCMIIKEIKTLSKKYNKVKKYVVIYS
jgi:hypothetical protein